MKTSSTVAATAVSPDVAEARFGFRVAALLNRHSDELPHAVQERLRFSRQQALAQRQLLRASAPAGATGNGLGSTLSLTGGHDPGWVRWLSVLPLVMLVVGLFVIQYEHGKTQVEVAADIDAALLGDDLPPAAYRDAGFVEYLKAPRN